MANKPYDFDGDDDLYCGIVGGELTNGATHEGLYDFEPGALVDLGAQHKIRVLGTLDLTEFHDACEGTRGK